MHFLHHFHPKSSWKFSLNIFSSGKNRRKLAICCAFHVEEFHRFSFFHDGGWREITWACSFHNRMMLYIYVWAMYQCGTANAFYSCWRCRVCVLNAEWFIAVRSRHRGMKCCHLIFFCRNSYPNMVMFYFFSKTLFDSSLLFAFNADSNDGHMRFK